MKTIPLEATTRLLTFGGWLTVASVERVNGHRFIDGEPMALLRVTTEDGHVVYLRYDAVFGVETGTEAAATEERSTRQPLVAETFPEPSGHAGFEGHRFDQPVGHW